MVSRIFGTLFAFIGLIVGILDMTRFSDGHPEETVLAGWMKVAHLSGHSYWLGFLMWALPLLIRLFLLLGPGRPQTRVRL